MSPPICSGPTSLLRSAHDSGVELAVFPSFSTLATASAPTLVLTARRRKAPRFRISASAASSGRWGSRRDSSSARGGISTIRSLLLARRRSAHLPQAQSRLLGTFSISPWAGAAGRVDAVGPDGLGHLCRHDLPKVWGDYRGRIDLAVVSAAWPDFADRDSGRRHWLFGHVGPLSGAIPAKVAP